MLLLILTVGKLGFVDRNTAWFRRQSPPDRVSGSHNPMHIQLEDNVNFLGYDLVGKGLVRPGGLLQVRLYWQATGQPSADYVSFIHLDAPPDNTTFATTDNYHPGDPQAQNDVPSSGWSPALYVRDEHRLNLPDDMPPIAYSLRAGLYDRQTGQRLSILPPQTEGQGGDAILLQQIHIVPTRAARLAEARYRQTYRLGESIELLGYNVEPNPTDGRIQAGQTISVTLFWRALEPVDEDYTVFVHLIDEAGSLQGQSDGPPVGGRYPTRSWLRQQIVEDESVLTLTHGLKPGMYRIAVGLYDLGTGHRLRVTGEDGEEPSDAILLAPVLQVGDQGFIGLR
jgi:hypothetical protein